MYGKASKIYNEFPGIYFDEYNDLSDAERTKMDPKYNPTTLTLDACEFDELYTKELDYSTIKCDEEKLDYLQHLEGDEEVKEGKKFKNLNSQQTANQASSYY